MSTSMIAVQDLVPGMIIGEPVLSGSGKILLGQDVVIAPRVISLLLMWNVNHVFIINETESILPAAENPPEQPLIGQGGVAEDFIKFIYP